VLPACAGMIPQTDFIDWLGKSAPRLRGDDPLGGVLVGAGRACSPPARG